MCVCVCLCCRLVDRDWTVKVCDFGLSQVKNAAFLTSKSQTGTPGTKHMRGYDKDKYRWFALSSLVPGAEVSGEVMWLSSIGRKVDMKPAGGPEQ